MHGDVSKETMCVRPKEKGKSYGMNNIRELSCDMINGFQNKRAAVGGFFDSLPFYKHDNEMKQTRARKKSKSI